MHKLLSTVVLLTLLLLDGMNMRHALAETDFNCSNVTEIPQTECEDLVAVHNATGGANWTNNTDWLVTYTPCSWYGVTCEEGHVRGLGLENNQLTGTIPSELGNLTSLGYLYLYNNKLSSAIPSALGNLTSLQDLELEDNLLSGAIPSELGNLTSLQYILLSNNLLSGAIPSELGNLTSLQYIWLQGNQLTGEIPASLTNLSNILYLDIGYNALYANDETLITFLNSKDSDWESTQTVASENVTAVSITDNSILVQWTPVTYTTDPGSYIVYYSRTPGGPYTLFGTAGDKSSSQMKVTGLQSDTAYYFVVKTLTYAHPYNQNTVYSDYSEEMAAVTSPFPWELFYPAITGKR